MSFFVKTLIERRTSLVLAFVIFWCHLGQAQFSSEADKTAWFTDGAVYSAVQTNGILYIGGRFSQIGPPTEGFAAIRADTGVPFNNFPSVSGSVAGIISDGAGGVFIGGNFNKAGNLSLHDIAHIFDDGQINTNFVHSTDGEIRALALYGSTLFIGGSFSSVDNQQRSHLAAINLFSGNLESFSLSIDWPVSAMTIIGDTLYLGGSFTQINASNRHFLAAVDLTTGQVKPWNPVINSTYGYGVGVLNAADERIYVGGDFTQINGVNRSGVAAFDAISGSLHTWNPNPESPFTAGGIVALTVSSNAVYIAGNFERIGGQDRNSIGAVDKVVGNATSWQPGIWANGVRSLAVSGNTIYMGGDFLAFASNGPPRLAAVDATTGAPLDWKPAPNSLVTALMVDDGKVFVGGHFTSIGGLYRQLLGAIDLSNGQALSWNANVAAESASGDAIYSMAIRNDSLFAAGRFWGIGGQPRVKIGAVNLTNALAQPFDAHFGPNLSAQFFTLVCAGLNLIGTGVTWTGEPVVLHVKTGQNVPWNFGTDGAINSFVATDTTLYVGGVFNNVNGQSRKRLAAYDVQTRQLLPWNPEVNGPVKKLLIRDQHVIAVGSFQIANNQACTNIAVFDSVTGKLGLGPRTLSTDGDVIHIASSSNSFYVTGGFTHLNGVGRTNFGGIDLLLGQTRNWIPDVKASFNTGQSIGLQTIIAPNDLILVGTIYEVGGDPRSGLARFPLTNQPSVKILIPTNGTSVSVPAQITISVDANSEIHGISRVEIYDNTNLLCHISNPPYTTNWVVPKHVGSHLITAVAYDQTGEYSFSSAARVYGLLPTNYVNPTVEITFPTQNAIYAPFTNLSIQTTITSPSSAIETGELLLGTNVIATLLNNSLAATLTNLAPGTYSVSAKIMVGRWRGWSEQT